MAVIQVPAWQCDDCEYIWLKVKGRMPKQCPNRDCRSRKWNSKSAAHVPVVVERKASVLMHDLPPPAEPKVTDVRFESQPPFQQRPSGPTKTKIDSLRSMIAGIESQQQACAPRLEPEPEADVTPVCEAEFCGKQLRGVANRLGIRWACADPSCTMFGREQKGRK